MGRRSDPPALQQAKGNPGRRGTKVQQQIARAEEAAQLLEAMPFDEQDALPPPAFLNDARLAPALRIWREVGPELQRTQRLASQHRLLFAMFCVYTAEWLDATRDILDKGRFQTVPTVALGGKMERVRPIVAFREIAYRNAIDLGAKFGLTPREEYALFRDQADAFARNPGLFSERGQSRAGDAPAADDAKPTAPHSLIGSLDAFDSAPPGNRPN